ncbi:adenylate kinase 7 [Xenentodon cancila]
MARPPRRVFLNDVDSFSSKHIAEFLSGVRAPDYDGEDEEAEAHLRGPAGLQVVGTVSGASDEIRTYVLEEYVLPGRDELLSKLMECDIVIYNISQDADTVEEATWAVTGRSVWSQMHLGGVPEGGSSLGEGLVTPGLMLGSEGWNIGGVEAAGRSVERWSRRGRYQGRFKVGEKNGVSDGVEGYKEVEEDENAEVAGVCREEEVIGDVEEGCFCAVISSSHFSRPKMFILISTVMTWACSKPVHPEDPELPLTDEIFWIRRAHPNFRRHIDLEKKVVKMGKMDRALFSTYVVASGLQFGMGEQIFQYFFKKSWLGQEHDIPVFGDGKNIVPTIHIRDLASVVQNVIQNPPAPSYLLAVDHAHNSMEDIIKAVAATLGPGRIQKRPWEEALLLQDMSVMEVDSLLVNLRMEAIFINKLFSLSWWCESGLVENIELVVEEYRQSHGLQPIGVCVLGPPAVGKTTVSRQICEHYHLHHITMEGAVSEAITALKEAMRNVSPADVQEHLSGLKDGGVHSDVSEQQLQVLKNKLKSHLCRNQGFVLDGFPHTYEAAQELFCGFVIFLDASDDFLLERVINLPEQQMQELSYDPESFQKRLTAFRQKNLADQTTSSFFLEEGISAQSLEVNSSKDPDGSLLIQKIFELLGSPRIYSPSRAEEDETRRAEESMRKEVQEKEEEEQREQESMRRAACWEDWSRCLEEARQQDVQQLEVQSAQTRSYLMEHVTPMLVQGLMECCRTRPADPVDFLAEFLFKNDPLSSPK